MKIEYPIKKKCDGCDDVKQTREHEGLDPKRPLIVNYICKRCDSFKHTIRKILEYNRKHLRETHSIFGFLLSEKDNIVKIEINFF